MAQNTPPQRPDYIPSWRTRVRETSKNVGGKVVKIRTTVVEKLRGYKKTGNQQSPKLRWAPIVGGAIVLAGVAAYLSYLYTKGRERDRTEYLLELRERNFETEREVLVAEEKKEESRRIALSTRVAQLEDEKTVLASKEERQRTKAEDFEKTLLGNLLPQRIFLFDYSVRDSKSQADAKEAGSVSGRIAESIVVSYPGNDEHFVNLMEYLKGRRDSLSKLGISDLSYAMQFEEYSLSSDRVDRTLNAIRNNKESLPLPKYGIVFDSMGMIINGNAADLQRIVQVMRSYGVTPVLDINPNSERIARDRSKEKELDETLRVLKEKEGGIVALSKMYFPEESDYQFLLAGNRNIEGLSRRYGVFHWKSLVGGGTYNTQLFSQVVNEFASGDEKIGVNSLDEPFNPTALRLDAYYKLLEKTRTGYRRRKSRGESLKETLKEYPELDTPSYQKTFLEQFAHE